VVIAHNYVWPSLEKFKIRKYKILSTFKYICNSGDFCGIFWIFCGFLAIVFKNIDEFVIKHTFYKMIFTKWWKFATKETNNVKKWTHELSLWIRMDSIGIFWWCGQNIITISLCHVGMTWIFFLPRVLVWKSLNGWKLKIKELFGWWLQVDE
jgi:hypothetical protein